MLEVPMSLSSGINGERLPPGDSQLPNPPECRPFTDGLPSLACLLFLYTHFTKIIAIQSSQKSQAEAPFDSYEEP